MRRRPYILSRRRHKGLGKQAPGAECNRRGRSNLFTMKQMALPEKQGLPLDQLECNMVARGRVLNGVVVLDNGFCFSEGQEVTVIASGPTSSMAPMRVVQPHELV